MTFQASRAYAFHYRSPKWRRLLDKLNPLLTIILAFWALWHCRHARPPDALSAR